MRRTLQHKYNRVAAALAGRDRPDLTPTEREALLESMRREIAGAWHTEEVRRERPSPLDEVRSGMAVFEETIWNAVPELCRSLDRTLRRIVKRPPAARCRSHSLRLVDRRRPRRQPVGNPRGHEARGVDVALDGVDAVRARESRCSASSCRWPARAPSCWPAPRARTSRIARCCVNCTGASKPRVRVVEAELTGAAQPELDAMPLTSDEELAEPLRLCDASLRSVGSDLIADGRLTDVLRRVVAFGLTLVRLDVRQEAATAHRSGRCHRPAPGTRQLRRVDRRAARRFPAEHPARRSALLGTEGLRPERARDRRARRRSG